MTQTVYKEKALKKPFPKTDIRNQKLKTNTQELGHKVWHYLDAHHWSLTSNVHKI